MAENPDGVNYQSSGSTPPFQENNPGRGPGALGHDFSRNINYNTDDPKGTWGLGSKEEEQLKNQNQVDLNMSIYRPLNALVYKDYSKLKDHEQLQINEALRTSMVDGVIALDSRMTTAIETFNYKTLTYAVQSEREMATRQVNAMEGLMYASKEGENERLLGMAAAGLKRQESEIKLFEFTLPYKTLYYSGMDSLALLSQRGGQLYLGDMHRFFNGVDAEWLNEDKPEPFSLDQQPESEVQKRADEIKNWEELKDKLPLVEGGETLEDRQAMYTAHADHWMRVVGEMNTYNPLVKGETLNVSETTQQFVADMLQRRPRTLENGTKEDISNPTRKITVYLDSNGDQIPYDGNGNPPTIYAEKHDAYVEVLDYYNKSRSEEEIRWFICAVSAMSIHDAKGVLDSLPSDIASAKTVQDDQDGSTYNRLWGAVQKTANEMMKNYDIPRRKNFNHKLAKSGVYLADALGFGTFDIAERGWNYEWKQEKDGNGKLFWKAEPSQGDPTASGDAFTASRPYFHEVVYQGIKSRISAFNAGALLPVDPSEAEKMAKIYVSEAAEANDRTKTIEMLAKGKNQQHLVKYFGILGAFSEKLRHLPAYKEGVNKRISMGKNVNENFSKAVEEYVVFVPTPFGNSVDKKLIYPMLAPQHKIGLYDMLTTDKQITVGDLLRKTWKRDAEGILKETPSDEGGVRLTLQDIDWKQYARYASDSAAVNNNFMLQIFSPMYGALNPKQTEFFKSNPFAAITTSIKASDIGFRGVIKRITNPTNKSGGLVKRPTLEIMHASQIAFQQLALGVHGLIGRGSTVRYKHFFENIEPQQQDKKSANLYSTLRGVEDLLETKQGYEYYADSYFCMMVAMGEALKPITYASDDMADQTTKRFEQRKVTNIEILHKETVDRQNRGIK